MSSLTNLSVAFSYNRDGTASVLFREMPLRPGEDSLKRLKSQIQHLFDIIGNLNETIRQRNFEKQMLESQIAQLQSIVSFVGPMEEILCQVRVQQCIMDAKDRCIAELQRTIEEQRRTISDLEAQRARTETPHQILSPLGQSFRRTSVSPINYYDPERATPLQVSSSAQTNP